MSELLPWSNIPGVPRLTTEFILGRKEIIKLLGGDWRDKSTRKHVRDRRLSFNTIPDLGKAIRETYNGLVLSPAVERNLDDLDNPNALAIITGQQPGLFGGPIYTFYKALSAVLLARELEHEHDGPVVPIFWIESADTDFSEINRIGFPPTGENPRRSAYTPRDIVAGRSIHYHVLNGEIEGVRNEVSQWMTDLPRNQHYIKLLNRTYYAGRLISDAFRDLMTSLLGDLGLVIVDALHPSLITQFTEFWEKCLERPERLNKSFSLASRDIESLRLPLQVRLREDTLPIFYIDSDGMRRRIHGSSDEWFIGQENEVYSNKSLRKLIEDPTGHFSPGVLLRPVYQDWLLPTWIYLGGPSEIAYHAQIGRCYDLFNMPRPLTAPRISITLIEQSARRWLNKHGWTAAEVIGGRELLLRRSGRAEALSELFDKGIEHLKGWLERIERAADESAINLTAELDRSGRKMEYQWQKLNRITSHKLFQRDKARVEHADKLLNYLLPDEMLQERHNNVLYYLSVFGDQFIQTIEAEVNVFNPQHFVIDLEID